MIHGQWRVSGSRVYRGHAPGEEFPALLPTTVAARAIARGDLLLLEEFVPALPDGYRLPEGWDG